MKKIIVIILIFLFLMPLNIYAHNNAVYFDTHLQEIKELNSYYNIKDGEKLIDNKKLNTVEILKKIYGSIDSHSSFYSKDELKIDVFHKKDLVNQTSVDYEINEDICYIRIYNFNDNVHDKVVDILKIMDDEKINKILLDLRDNKGGDIMESIKVAQLFVKEGLIAKIHYYSEELEDVEYYSNLKELKYNLIVLVNEETASAAELLAGAVQDSESGYIVGNKTFGKAKIQKFIPIATKEIYMNNLSNKKPTINLLKAIKQGFNINDEDLLGWAKLTVGCFYTKSGKEIDDKGINPDYIYIDRGQDIYFKIDF